MNFRFGHKSKVREERQSSGLAKKGEDVTAGISRDVARRWEEEEEEMTEEEAEWCRRWLYGKPEYEIGFPGVLELVKEVRNHQTCMKIMKRKRKTKETPKKYRKVGVVFSVESKEGGVVGEEARLTSAEDRFSHSAIPAERACSVLGTRDDKRKPSKSKS
ncbi:hypothetical protein HID58_055466 [Brassica napus]|uniref:Uncharacterized protein n=1 Tax=Brassica napus TaxID=3708 RepID=A0ABQ8AKK3_BRANA|nr:hypothetical protein HID58_055466 [Brassica napus]